MPRLRHQMSKDRNRTHDSKSPPQPVNGLILQSLPIKPQMISNALFWSTEVKKSVCLDRMWAIRGLIQSKFRPLSVLFSARCQFNLTPVIIIFRFFVTFRSKFRSPGVREKAMTGFATIKEQIKIKDWWHCRGWECKGLQFFWRIFELNKKNLCLMVVPSSLK